MSPQEGREGGLCGAMSEEALLEEDIWEYRSVRKRKQQSASERPSAPLRKVTEGRGRLKRRNGNKRKSVGKNGDHQESEPTSQPNEDPEASKDDSSVLSQESTGSQAERSPQSTRPVHDGHCPSCQMPFALLRVQTPRWHVAECLDTPGSTEKGRSRVREKLFRKQCESFSFHMWFKKRDGSWYDFQKVVADHLLTFSYQIFSSL